MKIDVIELVLREAEGRVGAGELPPASNAGPYVERVLKRVGLEKHNPWCAAEVADIGAVALLNLWPLPLTGSCQALFEFATRKGIVVDEPHRGDVFLIWHPELGRFAHTGFIIAVHPDGTCLTHEGNTTSGPRPGAPKDSREGWIVAEKTRKFKKEDRFINWAPLVSMALGE